MSTKRFVALVMALAMMFTLLPVTALAEGEYAISIDPAIAGGSVETDPKNEAAEGEEVTITVSPADGYHLEALTVKDGDNQDVEVTNNKFTMPAANVTVSATFGVDQFTVTFVDDNGITVSSSSYNYGTPADEIVIPGAPTKDDDPCANYGFAGWTPEVTAVTGNATYTATYDVALHHTPVVYQAAVEPTCSEGGCKAYYLCVACGKCCSDAEGTQEISSESLFIPATGNHTIEWKDAVPATCTEAGTDEYWECTFCHQKFSDADGKNPINAPGSTPALVHSFGEWEVTTEPTCTEDGEETRTCSRCDAIETRPVDALGHDYSAVNSATCTEAGVKTSTCSRCNDTYTEDAPALGHDYTTVVTEPTCTEQGYTTHTCSRCENSYADTYTDTLDHDYGEWTVTTEPTCTEAGEETQTCSR